MKGLQQHIKDRVKFLLPDTFDIAQRYAVQAEAILKTEGSLDLPKKNMPVKNQQIY